MQRIAWLTDIHLNFVTDQPRRQFLEDLGRQRFDALLLSGDIAEAPTVVDYLSELEQACGCPIYFVLGNHDFYFGSIDGVRRQVEQLSESKPSLRYLSSTGWYPMSARSAVVGHDGWADAREGDYLGSYVMMNDYKLIAELAPHTKLSRWEKLQQLGDQAAAHIRRVLPEALAAREHVFLVTHVPPLRSACWYNGTISDDEWAPHFTCKAVGDAIIDVMRRHPEQQLTVLCGHTHSPGVTQPLDNVVIHTGGADYGRPAITRVFELGG
jgi:3',5'-cyclic-AMP phosphodiesterase